MASRPTRAMLGAVEARDLEGVAFLDDLDEDEVGDLGQRSRRAGVEAVAAQRRLDHDRVRQAARGRTRAPRRPSSRSRRSGPCCGSRRAPARARRAGTRRRARGCRRAAWSWSTARSPGRVRSALTPSICVVDGARELDGEGGHAAVVVALDGRPMVHAVCSSRRHVSESSRRRQRPRSTLVVELVGGAVGETAGQARVRGPRS